MPTGNTFPSGTPLRMTPPTIGQVSLPVPLPSVTSRLAITTLHAVAVGPVDSVTGGGAVTCGLHVGGGVTVPAPMPLGVDEEELSAEFSSAVLLETVAVFSRTVPETPAVKVSLNVATAPFGRLAIWQSAPLHVNAGPVVWLNELKLAFETVLSTK